MEDGEQHEPEVRPGTGAGSILEVYPDLLRHDLANIRLLWIVGSGKDLRLIPEAQRCRTGNTGHELKNLLLARGIQTNVLGDFRSGTNERHLTEEDVHDLRQLVQLELTQPTSDARDPGIATHRQELLALAGLPHAPELPHQKGSSPPADPLLAKEDRAAVVELDQQWNEDPQRPGYQQPHSSDNKIEQTLTVSHCEVIMSSTEFVHNVMDRLDNIAHVLVRE